MEKRPWSEPQDQCLKMLFESGRATKWSQVAREMELHGYRGRNGVQCKERYCSHINPLHPRDEWSYEEELQMVELHNHLGNKWAQIGKKLGGRSDNCVKNQFYCLLRKALKRVNRVVGEMERDIKEFKPNILYKVVQVAQQKFKDYPNHSKEFCFESNTLKNELVKYGQRTEEQEQEEQMVEGLIDQLNHFRNNYQKKAKKSRKNSAVEQDLLTPTRYSTKHLSEHDQSDNSSACPSSEVDSDVISERLQRGRSRNSRSIHSMEEDEEKNHNNLLKPGGARMPTRSRSQGSLLSPAAMSIETTTKEEQPEAVEPVKEEHNPIEQMLEGLNLLGEEADSPMPMFMRKMESTRSKESKDDCQQVYRFFEDTPIHMTIRYAGLDPDCGEDFGMVDE